MQTGSYEVGGCEVMRAFAQFLVNKNHVEIQKEFID